MLHKVKAVVLRTTRYSETSVIALMYTDVFGMQSYMINGVRKQKAKITYGMLQPLSLVDAEVYHKEGGDIQRLTELHLNPVLNGLLTETPRTVVAMFTAELLTRAIREEEGHPELFEFLTHHIQLLDIHPAPTTALMGLMVGLSALLGFQPDGLALAGNWLNLTEGRFEPQRDQRSVYARPETADQLSRWFANRSDWEEGVHANTIKDLLLLYQLHLPGFKTPKSSAMLFEMSF